MAKAKELTQADMRGRIDAELIFGAMRREKQWKIAAGASALLSGVALIAASVVLASYAPPAPVLVPYDVATGRAIQNAAVEPVTLDEQRSVIEASVYRYVVDRETYNQVDNDVRIKRALDMSDGRAKQALSRRWSAASADYPPTLYGDDAEVEVEITSITLISNERVQINMRKRLVTDEGFSEGQFTAVLAYSFDPGEEKTLEAVWQNPLGFKVHEYSITSNKRGPIQ